MEDRTEYFKEYRKNNKEKIREKNREIYQLNKVEINKKKKIYQDNHKEELKAYRESIKEESKLYMIEYRIINKEKIKEKQREYFDKNEDDIKRYKKEYNKNYSPEYVKNRMKVDELFKFTNNIRNLIRKSFKRRGLVKNTKTQQILCCSFIEFKEYIEQQFEPWMNWNNYGLYNGTEKYGWDIDHIIGIKNGNSIEDIIKLNHYTNLRPLCSYYNRCIKK